MYRTSTTSGIARSAAVYCDVTSARSASSAIEVSVLGTFDLLVEGKPRRGLPHGSQRLLAFLALRDRAVTRRVGAGTLWPEVSEEHANASLRSAVSRLNGIRGTVVRVTSRDLSLADGVSVDIRHARLLAHRLVNAMADDADLSDQAILTLSVDLLPDWYDDWAVAEAEEWRQLRLHALDNLAERLIAAGRHADAISAALAAVKAEPLRETAHAVLIRIYLAEGNRAEALNAYRHYRTLLRKELGLEPTSAIQELFRGLL
jgi:DNA-binding SARP family transcriptional activator